MPNLCHMPADDTNQKLGGPRKAALLLLSLGQEEAAKIMAHLDDRMIEEVVLEMSKIRSISSAEKETILKEFKQTVDEIKSDRKGGLNTAREILLRSLGPNKTDEILKRIDKKDVNQDFEFLNEIDSQILQNLLSNEAPQTIAVTLAYIQPKKAAEVLKLFPEELQSKIALKLASTTKTHPEAVLEIARILKKKYETRDKSELTEAGGTQALANILNHMDKTGEDNILKELNDKAPELAGQVKEKLYVFEDILNLDSKEMRTLLGKLGGNDLLIFALRGADEEVKRHFFSAMSQNRASDVIEEMDAMGKTTLKEIMTARNKILFIARELEEDGIIILKKRKEEFI